ncbi:MAG TPA: hypothetical protein VLM37_10475 [Fibrobacteraceae bacterium]|nr:hypothetical protein [Fibrobacteraceae bacterium]
MEMRVDWSMGQALCPGHLRIQENLAWSGLVQKIRALHFPAWGVIEARVDEEDWTRGILRWDCLSCISPAGLFLNQGPGVGALEPVSLELPIDREGQNLLSLWLWPSEDWLVVEPPLPLAEFDSAETRVPLRRRIWRQSFQKPQDCMDAICVQRWKRRSIHWCLDDDFLPPALRLVGSAPWRLFLEELSRLCLRLEKPELKILDRLLPILSQGSTSSLHLELVRYLFFPAGDPPTYDPAEASWALVFRDNLRHSLSAGADCSQVRVSLSRAGRQLFTASLQAKDWRAHSVHLIWRRTEAFQGDEVALLRLSALGQIPRLVRAALPGALLTPLRFGVGEGGLACAAFQVDGQDPLWQEALNCGAVALHCTCADFGDRFLLEVSE